MKKFALFAFLLLALALVSSSAIAGGAGSRADALSEWLANYGTDGSTSGSTNPSYSTEFVSINRIEVNGVVASAYSPVYLERGEEVAVEVYFTGNPYGKCESGEDNPCYDTKVEAGIEGYEYGDIRDVEGPFEVEPGVAYRKVLRFTLPTDMSASDDLDLNVEVKDDDDFVLASFPVRIQEPRHSLNVFDVVFNPSDNVQAGQPLFATVRVENLGDNTENSIKVTVAMPELGIETSEFVDKLATSQDENDDEDDNADDSATTNDLLLMIPANTAEGDYDVVVTLEYNRGHSTVEETYTMHVASGSQFPLVPGVTTTGIVVNVDSQTQRVNEGQGAVFKFSVANLGAQPGMFTFEVVGLEDWATARVDPTSLVVQPDNTGEAFVYVAPKEGAEGIKMFTVKVMSGENVVAEKQLSVEVAKSAGASAKTVFTWLFVVLLAILVILVVVVLVKRGQKDETSIEGQTYY